jgi:hypothetical protein
VEHGKRRPPTILIATIQFDSNVTFAQVVGDANGRLTVITSRLLLLLLLPSYTLAAFFSTL